MNTLTSRRNLLGYLCASPLILGAGCQNKSPQSMTSDEVDARIADILSASQPQSPILPETARQAASLYELRDVAEKNVPISHFEYMQATAGGGATARRNLEAFKAYMVRSRRLHGVDTPDISTTVLGEKWDIPIGLSPAGSQRAFHPGAELETAAGAKEARAQMILSTLSTTSIEDVTEARGAPIWFQLYVLNDEQYRKQLISRAENAGAKAIVVTVDDIGGRGSESFTIGSRRDTRNCSDCHDVPRTTIGHARRKPMVKEFASTPDFDLGSPNMDWDFLAKLRDDVKGKLVVKGILDPIDAQKCVSIGVDGVLVSNHGGRIAPNSESSLSRLPGVVKAANGKMTVLMDSGIRRGSDVFTALALGADAVCIGRPYLWGLGAFGAEGVSKVFSLLTGELRRSMVQSGAASLADITPDRIRSA